jgi:hypothetical protein
MLGFVLYQQSRPAFWRSHPFVTALALIGATWLLQHGWYLTVAVPAAAVVLIAVRRRRRDTAHRRAGLAARADIEHRMVLAGDARGIHGRYPPVRPGWFTDPANAAQLRYFDGAAWSRWTAAR